MNDPCETMQLDPRLTRAQELIIKIYTYYSSSQFNAESVSRDENWKHLFFELYIFMIEHMDALMDRKEFGDRPRRILSNGIMKNYKAVDVCMGLMESFYQEDWATRRRDSLEKNKHLYNQVVGPKLSKEALAHIKKFNEESREQEAPSAE